MTSTTDELARLDAYIAASDLPESGRAALREAFDGPPVRAVRSTPFHRTGRVAPSKSAVTNETDGRAEFEYQFELDADPDVLMHRTQALRLSFTERRPAGGGGTRDVPITLCPDVLVVRRGGVELVDLMRLDEVQERMSRYPGTIVEGSDGRHRYLDAEIAAGRYGFRYLLLTERDRSPIAARNARYLHPYLDAPPTSEAAALVGAVVRAEPGIALDRLIDGAMARGLSADDVLACITHGSVYVDRTSVVLDEQRHAPVYPDVVVARGFEAERRDAWSIEGVRPPRPEVTAGTRFVVDGREHRLELATDERVLLRAADDPGAPVLAMPRATFERDHERGSIAMVAADVPDPVAELRASRWGAASPADQDVALDRYRRVADYQRMSAAERAALDASEVRRLQRWASASQGSERSLGDPLVGLLPGPRRGNRSPRLEPDVQRIIDEVIATDYLVPGGRSKRAVTGIIRRRCREAGLRPPAPKTVQAAIARIPAYEVTRRREGVKRAYADKPFLPTVADASPVAGTHPLARVHIDFTTADIEVIDPATGADLGRPILGLMVDAYSERVLAHGWSFGSSTSADVRALLVRCAETYGRLPEVLVMDNAKQHKSVTLERFCATYRISFDWRPTAQARFGQQVERWFGRLNEELLHQLPGNTLATKHARTVTRETDPKRLAALSLGDVDALMTRYFLEDGERYLPRLRMTQRRAFEEGMVRHGARPGLAVSADDTMRSLALESVGTRKSQGTRGVFVDHIRYHHDCLVCVKAERVEVRVDALDIATVQVFVPSHWHRDERIDARWVTATSRTLAGHRVCTRAELAIASSEVRRSGKAGRAAAADPTEERIAALLEDASKVAATNIARLQADQLRVVRGGRAPVTALADEPLPATLDGGDAGSRPLPDAWEVEDTYFARHDASRADDRTVRIGGRA